MAINKMFGILLGAVYLSATYLFGLDTFMGAYFYGSGFGLITVSALLIFMSLPVFKVVKIIGFFIMMFISGYHIQQLMSDMGMLGLLLAAFFVCAVGCYLFLVALVSSSNESLQGAC